jgi:hypothetical protein
MKEPSKPPQSSIFEQVAAVLGIFVMMMALITEPDFANLATLITAIAALAALITIPNRLQKGFSIALSVGVIIAAVFVSLRTFSSSSTDQESPVPTAVSSAQFPQVTTPESGSISHPSPDIIRFACADVDLENFIAETRFFNPFDSAVHPWSYGLIFRYTSGDEYRLTVNHEGRIGFGLDEEGKGTVLAERFPEGINTDPDGSNFIRLTVQSEDAVVFINERYVATFDIGDMQDSGDVCLATGFFPGDNIPGQETVYQDFTIYELPE